MADVRDMNCCGMREIDNLADMSLTAKGAQEAFIEIRDELTTEAHYEERYNYGTMRWEQCDLIPELIRTPAFFVFTQAAAPDANDGPLYGDIFKEWIEAQNLGTVHESEPKRNENTGNLVTVFLWTVNQELFKTWRPAKKTKKKEAA